MCNWNRLSYFCGCGEIKLKKPVCDVAEYKGGVPCPFMECLQQGRVTEDKRDYCCSLRCCAGEQRKAMRNIDFLRQTGRGWEADILDLQLTPHHACFGKGWNDPFCREKNHMYGSDSRSGDERPEVGPPKLESSSRDPTPVGTDRSRVLQSSTRGSRSNTPDRRYESPAGDPRSATPTPSAAGRASTTRSASQHPQTSQLQQETRARDEGSEPRGRQRHTS